MDNKVTNSLSINVPKGGFVDEGDGLVSFPNGLTITDGSVQRNGTRYDIDSLDISRYGNQLTGDHKDELGNLIGETIGVIKKDGKVIVNKIRYAIKENPYARLAYDLLVGGFSKNFSTETIGPRPDETNGVYWNAELVGLSQVVTQNNYNAQINKVVHNSLERAKQDGLDITGIEEKVVKPAEEEKKMEEKDKKVVDTETKEEAAIATEESVNNGATTEADTETNTETVESPESQEADTQDESTEESTEEKVENEADKAEETTEETEAEAETQEEATAEKAENGTWIETTTTTTTREYVESEEEKEERKAREARWEREAAAERSRPETVVVVVDADNETEDKTENEAPEATETETADTAQNETAEEVEKETNNKEKSEMTKDEFAEAIANALQPLNDKIEAVALEAKNAFDASAKEPEFKKDENAVDEDEKAENAYAQMSFEDRYQAQVDAAWNAVKLGNVNAWQTLREINQVNLDGLKKAGIAKNAITLDDLGNFVIPEEMYREIQGHRTDYSAILDATEWRETLSLEFAWLERVGDIDMQSVAIGSEIVDENGPVADDARLKPISEYAAVPRKSPLEELAAVTVVATSTTRFAAVDLLADAAAGYRTDYDRKRAQLVIARLEQAVDSTGFSVAYNPSADVDALTVWLDAVTEISDTTLNGTLIFNARTFAELKSRALKAGANGPLSEILTTGDLPTVFGYRFIVVPNDLLPSLGGNETISFVVNGETVQIQHAVFFAELSTFTGRTSGGLQYDVSNSASYEAGGVVKSAYQRNELVLRGSFFRGGAVKDKSVVAGIRQGAGSNVS